MPCTLNGFPVKFDGREILFLFSCVCVCVEHMCVQVCLPSKAHVEARDWLQDNFLYHFSTLNFKIRSLQLTWSMSFQLDWRPRPLESSYILSAGIIDVPSIPRYFMALQLCTLAPVYLMYVSGLHEHLHSCMCPVYPRSATLLGYTSTAGEARLREYLTSFTLHLWALGKCRDTAQGWGKRIGCRRPTLGYLSSWASGRCWKTT